MTTGTGKLDLTRLIRGVVGLALLALYGALLFLRFSLTGRDVASDACGQVLYPDIMHLVSQIAVVAAAAPILAFLTRKWPGVRLAVVGVGISTLAVFMFAAHLADVVKWSCDLGGGVFIDYTTGVIGIVVLVLMGIASVADLRLDTSGVVTPVGEEVEGRRPS